MDNASISVLTFEFETNMDKALENVKNQLDNVSLPSSCSSPSITRVDLNGDAIATLALYGEDIDTLTKEAKDLKQKKQEIKLWQIWAKNITWLVIQ